MDTMTESDLAAIEARAEADLDEEITSAIGKERNEVVRLIRCSRTMRRRYDERTADVRALAAEVRRLRAVLVHCEDLADEPGAGEDFLGMIARVARLGLDGTPPAQD